MIKTYNKKAKVKILFYKNCKYLVKNTLELGKPQEMNYNVIGWSLVQGGIEAEEIEKDTDNVFLDEYHEYLILNLENGKTATFKNSHITMFVE